MKITKHEGYIRAPFYEGKTLCQTQGPFGFRLDVRYSPGTDVGIGTEGGTPGVNIIPVEGSVTPEGIDLTNIDVHSQAGANNQPLQEEQWAAYVNGGVYWCPWPATVKTAWPDKPVSSLGGVITWRLVTFDSKPVDTNGLFFTRWVRDTKTINLPLAVNAFTCPSTDVVITMNGFTFRGGNQKPMGLGGARSMTVNFLASMPATVTAVPITFWYLER